MAAITVEKLTHRYGRVGALREVGLEVQEGSLYALLGPNGAGKTTLLRILTGLHRPTSGQAWVLGREVSELRAADRARIAYVSEAPSLPGWMTVAELEAYLRPLYGSWDGKLAEDLRARFRLDPGRKIGTLSRGERMKAAMLCALAPRPRLLLLDEPFTGMDAVVRDELVRGLLALTGEEGWTVLVCSHEIGELEPLADWVGLLDAGRMTLSEPMEDLRARFRHVEVVLPTGEAGRTGGLWALPTTPPPEWLSVRRSGHRLSFLLAGADAAGVEGLRQRFPPSARIEIRPASLREVFVGLVKAGAARAGAAEVAA